MKTKTFLKNTTMLTVAAAASPLLILLYALLAMLMALLEKLAQWLQKTLNRYFSLMESVKQCFI